MNSVAYIRYELLRTFRNRRPVWSAYRRAFSLCRCQGSQHRSVMARRGG